MVKAATRGRFITTELSTNVVSTFNPVQSLLLTNIRVAVSQYSEPFIYQGGLILNYLSFSGARVLDNLWFQLS